LPPSLGRRQGSFASRKPGQRRIAGTLNSWAHGHRPAEPLLLACIRLMLPKLHGAKKLFQMDD